MSAELLAQGLLGVAVLPTAVAWRDQWTRVTPVAVAAMLAVLAGAGGLALVTDSAGAEGRLSSALVLALTTALAVAGGGPLTTQLFRLVDGQSPGQASVRQAGAVLRGGALIGALERGGVFASLVAGWPEGLAVVLAVKGLGRYPELRNEDKSGVAERFIIGTFSSVLWAVACAGVAHLLR